MHVTRKKCALNCNFQWPSVLQL